MLIWGFIVTSGGRRRGSSSVKMLGQGGYPVRPVTSLLTLTVIMLLSIVLRDGIDVLSVSSDDVGQDKISKTEIGANYQAPTLSPG